MKMKGKWIALLILTAIVFVGCSKKDKSESGSNGKKDLTLTFGINQTGTDIDDMTLLAGMFEEETGIKVDFQVYPDDQWRELLKTKLIAGEAPDMFMIDADPMSINDRIRPEENCIDFTNEEWVSRMDPAMLPSVSYKSKVYGMTFASPKRWVYFYRKDLFEQAGIAQVPTSYEELKADCLKLKELGIIPIFEATQNGWHQVLPLFETGGFMLQADPDLYDKLNTNQLPLSESPYLRTILEQLKEMAELGCFGENYLSENVDTAASMVGDGQAAIYLSTTGWEILLYRDYPEMEGKIGMFMMPYADSDVLGVNPANPSFFGNKNTGHVEEIKAFFAFLTRHDILDYHYNELSDNTEFCWPEIPIDPARMPKEYADYLSSVKTGTVVQYAVKYVDTQWMDVGRDIEGMYAGAMSIDDVLNEMDRRRTEQATLQNDEYWTNN